MFVENYYPNDACIFIVNSFLRSSFTSRSFFVPTEHVLFLGVSGGKNISNEERRLKTLRKNTYRVGRPHRVHRKAPLDGHCVPGACSKVSDSARVNHTNSLNFPPTASDAPSLLSKTLRSDDDNDDRIVRGNGLFYRPESTWRPILSELKLRRSHDSSPPRTTSHRRFGHASYSGPTSRARIRILFRSPGRALYT